MAGSDSDDETTPYKLHREEAIQFLDTLDKLSCFQLKWDALLDSVPLKDLKAAKKFYANLGKQYDPKMELANDDRKILQKTGGYLYDVQVNWETLARHSGCGSVDDARALYSVLVGLEPSPPVRPEGRRVVIKPDPSASSPRVPPRVRSRV
ncbi:hypothetical protein PG997_014912 [Apiospora hydei]|uniref:Uncharacterized protein n=1 Tax=Apiospora hydei TaxID=1337664 RepID=A0ABR1UV89_9PEZI